MKVTKKLVRCLSEVVSKEMNEVYGFPVHPDSIEGWLRDTIVQEMQKEIDKVVGEGK